MMLHYNPLNWYWVVAASTTQVYSSASATYVPLSDETYTAWLASGGIATQIDSEASLEAVFASQYPAGWPSVALKIAAQAALSDSDVTVIRCAEHSVATPSEWIAYRANLRSVVAGTLTTLPTKPAYPAGT